MVLQAEVHDPLEGEAGILRVERLLVAGFRVYRAFRVLGFRAFRV